MRRHIGLQRASLSVGTLIVCLFMTIFSASLFAQEDVDVAESIGIGLKSRFASGATPIEIERTRIVPGTPMSVNSTMNKIISSSSNSNSFGGILARYDTDNFGKFFGTGTMTPHASTSRIDALDNLATGDNAVENVDDERMYPPRLFIDFNVHPMRKISDPASRSNLMMQVENVVSRFEFDKKTENILIECKGSVVYLRGKVKSGRMARLIESVVNLQAGVDRVVNELVVAEPETKDVDVFGAPAKKSQL